MPRPWLGALALVASVATSAAAQPALVDPGAHQIRAYRLSLDNVRKFDQVSRALDAFVPPSKEAGRPDVMTFVVLSMSIPHRTPFTDAQVDDMVRTVDAGHDELARAIQRAGLSTRDYVLTELSLLLAYPLVNQKRQGRAVTTTDVSGDSLAVIEANWTEVDRIMREFIQRVHAERARQGG